MSLSARFVDHLAGSQGGENSPMKMLAQQRRERERERERKITNSVKRLNASLPAAAARRAWS